MTPMRRIPRWRAWVALGTVTVAAAGSGYLAARSARNTVEALAVRIAQDQRELLVAGCNRGRDDRLDTIELERDVRRFMREAARRANRNGDHDFALDYAELAGRATSRIQRRRGRLLPCDQAYPPVRTRAVREALHQNRTQ